MLSPHFNRAYFSCMLGRAPKRLRIFFMDKVRRLEMVVRAADLGGFAAAAKHMNVTPSAVSRGVAELERTLRISIFNRSTRQMQLTQAGSERRTVKTTRLTQPGHLSLILQCKLNGVRAYRPHQPPPCL